ncbi:MAG: hypothetical protein Q8R40_00090, partial [bacterium]|nr:hypothetical protein [bacterium]
MGEVVAVEVASGDGDGKGVDDIAAESEETCCWAGEEFCVELAEPEDCNGVNTPPPLGCDLGNEDGRGAGTCVEETRGCTATETIGDAVGDKEAEAEGVIEIEGVGVGVDSETDGKSAREANCANAGIVSTPCLVGEKIYKRLAAPKAACVNESYVLLTHDLFLSYNVFVCFSFSTSSKKSFTT